MQPILKERLFYHYSNWKDLAIILLILIIPAMIFNLSFAQFNIKNTLFLLSIQNLILIFPIILFISKGKASSKSLFFSKFSFPKALKHIIIGFLIFMGINLLVATIQHLFNIKLLGYGTQPSYQEVFQGLSPFLIILSTSIIAPIIEETLFRGLILQKTPGSLNTKILISSFLFSLFHLQPTVILPLFILGVILAKITTAQNSIWPAIIFHSLNNLLATFVLLLN